MPALNPRLQITTEAPRIVISTSQVSAPPDRITYVTDPIAAHQQALDSGQTGGVFVFECGRTYKTPFGGPDGVCRIPSTESNPLVLLSTNSTLARPIIQTGGLGGGFIRQGQGARNIPSDHIHLFDLQFDQRPGESGISWLGPGNDLHVENCRFKGGLLAINYLGDSTGNPFSPTFIHNVIHDQASYENNHAQGILLGSPNCRPLIEHNIFDRIGKGSIFSHGIYIKESCGDAVEVLTNLFSRCSSHAVQARSGGAIVGNYVSRCPCTILLGGGDTPVPGGVSGTVIQNIFQEACDIASEQPRAWGIEFSNVDDGTAHGNIFTRKWTGHCRGTGFSIRVNNDNHRLESQDIYLTDNEDSTWPGRIEIWNARGRVHQASSIYKLDNKPSRCIQEYERMLTSQSDSTLSLYDSFMNKMREYNLMADDANYNVRALMNWVREGWSD